MFSEDKKISLAKESSTGSGNVVENSQASQQRSGEIMKKDIGGIGDVVLNGGDDKKDDDDESTGGADKKDDGNTGDEDKTDDESTGGDDKKDDGSTGDEYEKDDGSTGGDDKKDDISTSGDEKGAGDKENDEESSLVVEEKEAGEEGEEEERSRTHDVGLDGGYGWAVVAGAFICFVIAGGYNRSSGILFIQIQERYKTGALKAAWPVSLSQWIQNLIGPLVAAVCNKYSVRTSMMIGATVTFIGLILNSLVDNFYFLFFCHSLLQGGGIAFMLSPGLYIVSSYFEKRRGFAVSLASSGSGVGVFAMVPLVNYLFEVYAYQGCFLVLAGILANCYVVAMLHRPFSIHQKYILAEERNKNKTRCLHDHEKEIEENGLIPLEERHTATNKTTLKKPQKYQLFSCFDFSSFIKICFPKENKKTGKNKIFQFFLLKDPSFFLFLVSTFLFSLSIYAVYTFVPPACVEKGLSKEKAALVLSIVGAVDTCGRVLCGFLVDLPTLKPHRYKFFIGYLFSASLSGFFIPFLDSFGEFVIVCCLLGVSFGLHVSQRTVVLVDLRGKEFLPSCIGFTRVFQAFSALVGPLLCGVIRDVTGSYDSAFFVISGVLLMAGVLMGLSHVIFHVQHRKKQQQEQE